MSVFDRIKARRSGATIADAPQSVRLEPSPTPAPRVVAPGPSRAAPTPATLEDVAQAIALAATAQSAAAREEIVRRAEEAEAPTPEPEPAEDPDLLDAGDWRSSVVRSLNETREELKTARSNVARLRKRLVDFDQRRIERREKISANLTRAESLLTEIRDAWR
jgi:hypothetical protein